MPEREPYMHEETGFALFTTMVIAIVVGILAISGLRQNQLLESLSGNSIQRSRSIAAAEGALTMAEESALNLVQDRSFSSPSGPLYSSGNLPDRWWNDNSFEGAHSIDDGTFVGVIDQPEYVAEEVGYYQTDGGTGIVSLDRGSSAYGSLTVSGREVVLFRFQSKGLGSTESTQAITESLYAQTR